VEDRDAEVDEVSETEVEAEVLETGTGATEAEGLGEDKILVAGKICAKVVLNLGIKSLT
jgi:hypothetical protein